MRKAITALDCQRLKDDQLVDERSPGLRLVARQRTKSWIYRYRARDGRLRQLKLGEFPEMGLADARAEWARQRAIRENPERGDPRRERIIAERAAVERLAPGYTFGQLIDDYVARHVSRLKKQAETKRMLDIDLPAAWRGRLASDITRRDIVDLIERIDERAPRIATMVSSSLRVAFNLAIDRDRIEGPNPVYRIRTAQYVPRDRAFSDGELKVFFGWLPSSGLSANVRDALMLTLLTACRSGEACRARWEDLHLSTGEWIIGQDDSKSKRTQTLLLSRQARALLEARRQSSTARRHVFTSQTGNALHQHALVWAVCRARESSGLKHWSAHDLRRTALTGLARLGCPRVVQDRISGHTDRSIAAIYDRHRYDVEAREWWQRWADHLDTLRAAGRTARGDTAAAPVAVEEISG